MSALHVGRCPGNSHLVYNEDGDCVGHSRACETCNAPAVGRLCDDCASEDYEAPRQGEPGYAMVLSEVFGS